MSTLLFLESTASLEQVRAWASALGLTCSLDVPRTQARRTASFRSAGVSVSWLGRAGASRPLLVVQGDEEAKVASAARATLGGVDTAAMIAALEKAAQPLEQLRALFDLGLLCELGPCDERALAVEALAGSLLSEERALRYGAARLLVDVIDRRVEALLAAAAERFPDLAPAHASVREACEAQEDGTLYDGPTDDWWTLEQRAREGAAAGQWKRVAKAADDLLAQDADHIQGLHYRALAHEALGEPLLALATFGAALEVIRLEIEVADESSDEDEDEDDDDDESSDEDEDEDESDEEEDEKAEERALLASIPGRIAELRARIAELDTARVAAGREQLLAVLERWWKDESTLAAGAAAALGAIDPEIEAVTAFLAGDYHGEVEKLERALALAPDSPKVALRLAEIVGRTDAVAAGAAYEALLARFRAGTIDGTSPAARLIARFEKEPVTLGGVLEQLALAAYEKKDRRRAMALADELVRENPGSVQGWQLRGHARLFEHLYAEAAEAYGDALRELDRIYTEGKAEGSIFFGDDPRAMMHFNRACAYGKLGMKEETLESLRLAVRAKDSYADDVLTEEWVECVWGTPELEAIARREPRALATRDELEAPFVQRLIDRCKARMYRGEPDASREAGERAVELASFRGDSTQEAQALSALSYTLAFSGDPGRAVELIARAVHLAEGLPVALRAEAVATQAVVLHAHGDLEGAERAYLRGVALRKEAFGDDAPVLAKSYGDLARLRADQGRPFTEVKAMTEQGIEVLARYLATHGPSDEDWIEAISDRSTLEVNLALDLARAEAWAESVSMLEAAATTFEATAEHMRPSPGVLASGHRLAERLVAEAGDEAPRAAPLVSRFEALRFPGPPAVRRERLFFARLRAFAERMRNNGVTDGAIAEALKLAVRGADALPEPLREVPELASLAGELAARSARYPTFIVMAAMSFEMMASDLDRALQDLEELCVGYAMEAEG
jgi:hypothetical protein